MSGFDRLPEAAAEVFGEGATATEAYGLLTVDVPAGSWVAALTTARDELGCTFFDWLSAVDEPGAGFQVCAHVARLPGTVAGNGTGTGGATRAGVRRLLVRTTVPHDAPSVPTATAVYPGAAWHERETHEMFGVDFPGHPRLAPLLLPDEFEGHPLRKDFVLAARVAKAWPGAKEPGESHDGGPRRRQMLPPGVPDPNEWGPLKGQLPPAPARPARAGRAAAGGAAGAPAERPARRMRSAGQGSASQQPAGAPAEPSTPDAPGAPASAPAGEGPAPRPGKRVPDAPWEQPREPGPAKPEAPRPGVPEPEPGPAKPEAPEPDPGKPGPSEPGAPEPAAGEPPASPADGDAPAPDPNRDPDPSRDPAPDPDPNRDREGGER